MEKPPSERERRFIEAFMGEAAGNATEAARLAGYSPKSARRIGTRLSSKVHIRAAIEQRQSVREQQSDIDAARVIKELARIGLSDVRKLFREDGGLKAFKDMDDDTAAALAGVDVVEMAGGAKIGGAEGVQHVAMFTKKVKFWDKPKALEMIGRYLAMWKDKVGGEDQPEPLRIEVTRRAPASHPE